ncbi:cyclopropane-fatty-acyl-phospholipid synthase family protein [Paraconexibacter sp.]|uniref:SAM-dependent methyltransferase n=1 Tax=Paraconexibacter sp. TaxID=2949640 RepID=UPI0035644BFF
MAAPTDARQYRLLDLALERDVVPDAVLRAGSRWGARDRLRRERRGGVEAQEQRLRELLERKSSGPIAEATEAANEQHYELPADFIGLILGPRRKYSGCLWAEGVQDLAGAEEAMLRLTCERAQVQDGMEILDLGCGWGSLSLWLAEQYPKARIVGVSNSAGQREHIEAVAAEKGLDNLEILTCDVNVFDTQRRFDRVMSIEMFEHMRNWKTLLARVRSWLEPGGKLFVHVFSQRQVPYQFEGTWAAERFFTAGLMPSHELLLHFQDDMVVTDRWAVDGTHYARTLVAWLANLDARRDEALEVLERVFPAREARRVLGGWRLFLISTDEIWRWRRGDEWLVSHYLLEPRR